MKVYPVYFQNSLTQTFYLTVSITSYNYFVKFEDVVIIFLRDLKTKLCKHNQKEVASAYYINVYAKGVLINDFFYVETSDTNLIERLSSPHLTQNLLKFRAIQKT